MTRDTLDDPAAFPTSASARRLSFLGVDIGGTSIKWSVLTGDRVTRSGSIPTPRVDHFAVLSAVTDLAHEMRADISGVGVAVPGTVNAREQRSVFLPNLPGDWVDFPVAAELERAVGVPVALVNDARAFAWAELRHGVATDYHDALFVTLGTGVGGAIALDGEVLVGDMDSIGEIGHFPVDLRGEICACGGRGCLETIASGSAIVGRLARTVAMSQSTTLDRLTDGGARPLTAELVARAARLGDVWSMDAFDRAADALAQAISAVSMVLQLQIAVIGGGLRPAADLYLPRIQAALDSRRSLTGPVLAVSAELGHEAGAVGAATVAARSALSGSLPHSSERTSP